MISTRRIDTKNLQAAVIALVVLAFNLGSVGWLQADEDARKELNRVQREYLDKIKPLLQQSCGDCHWGDGADADLNFEPFNSLDDILEATSKWKKVARRVEVNEMPPPDESEPLSASDKKLMLDWIDRLVNNIDCTDVNPGKATLRRLNRVEYRNTIRDLTGVNYRPAASFPGDDVGYGFDNIGEVLSLPPILMEKYLAAAERILDEAIPADQNRFTYYSRGADFASKNTKFSRRDGQSGALVFFANGTVTRSLNLPLSKRYQVMLHMHGDQAGEEPVKAALLVDGKVRKKFSVRASQPGEKIYEASIRLRKGERKVAVRFLNDYYQQGAGDRNLFLNELWIETESNSRGSQRIIFERPDRLKKNHREVARKIIRRFGSFAYRRPLRTSEIERLMELYDQATLENEPFDSAIRYTLQAVLVSPHFLFKVESPTSTSVRDVGQYELATSLSYFLWSTMPDAELFRAATNGDLNKPEVLEAQVKRMLADPRARSLVENFAGQWLQLRALRDFEPDPELFPSASKELLGAMTWETKLTVADVFLKNQSIFELLQTDSTYLNETLAKHYGIPGVQGREFQKVSLKGIRPGGILTQGSILTLTSNPTRTSPVKRGKWIMENLLADEPPPPDPDVMQLDDQKELTGTLRERMEQHRKDPACASCHKTMDVLGFALENFDAVGRWRDKDDGLPIDSSGTLGDGTLVSGADGLQRLLRNEMREDFVRCFTEKLLVYSLGRGLRYYDQCAVDKIIDQASVEEFRFHALVIAVVQSDPFLKRRGRPEPGIKK